MRSSAKRARKRSTALAVRHSSAPKRVGGGRRRGGGGGARAAELWGPLIAAGILGFAEREGITIPHFGAIGEAGTIAAVGFIALQAGIVPANMRKLVQNAVLAAGSLAAYEMAKSGALPGGAGKKAEGDFHSGPTIAHDIGDAED